MKAPLYDLIKNAQNDLKSKEEILKEFKEFDYIVYSLNQEIHNLKVLLSRLKDRLRDENLNELGL